MLKIRVPRFTDDDSAELAAIFVMLWKSAQFATWITEEQIDSIVVSLASMFWVSGNAASSGQVAWLTGNATRSGWQRWMRRSAIPSSTQPPLSSGGVPGTDSADPAYPKRLTCGNSERRGLGRCLHR